jgi:transketolase
MKKIDYEKTAKEIRKEILKMHFLSQESHIGSALSCVDILTVLYSGILSVNPQEPYAQNRDRFILSKGHATAALYATLALWGFCPMDVLGTFCSDKSKLAGHTTKGCIPGVEASAGSLGHGLSIGTGMALAAKVDNKKYRVFVLMGDGECDEGSVWEAALFCCHHKLDNMIVLIDYNKLQAFGKTNEVLSLEPFKKKWEAFGWEAREINGHDFNEIEETLRIVPFKKDKPSVVICHTIKGKGISFMENKLEWHYKSPNKQEYNLAIKELNKK